MIESNCDLVVRAVRHQYGRMAGEKTRRSAESSSALNDHLDQQTSRSRHNKIQVNRRTRTHTTSIQHPTEFISHRIKAPDDARFPNDSREQRP